MALPRSEDKRKAILKAAAKAVAEKGINAPTASIAKTAGVAEGTIFTYFKNKDDLLNEVYLDIKKEMSEMMNGCAGADRGAQLEYFWKRYVYWGVQFRERYSAMVQLSVSEVITPENKKTGSGMFAAMHTLLEAEDCSYHFPSAVLGSLADTTIRFMINNPDNMEAYADAGFRAFWAALGAI